MEIKRDAQGRDYLLKPEKIGYEIEKKQALMEGLKEIRDSVTVTLKERVQTSGISDFGDVSCKIVDLEKEIDELIAEKARVKLEVIKEIKKLGDNEEVLVLVKRYIQGNNLKQISVEQYWSYGKTKKLHGRALESFRKREKP